MKLEITPRDRKLLAGLGIVGLIACVMLLVFFPLKEANDRMEQQALDNEIQMAQIQQKVMNLPGVRTSHQEILDRLEAGRQGLYPMLKRQEIDRLLTQRVVSMGLEARRLQIEMPGEPMNLLPYETGSSEGEETESSNPDGADGIWAADIHMEIAGSQDQLDQLIDLWSLETPGIRIQDFSWSEERNSQEIHILNLNLEILMCSDGEQKE